MLSFTQNSDEFVPVVCGREVLESLHRMEVIIKKWGPPIGNQYFKSVMPEISVTVCSSCNKVMIRSSFGRSNVDSCVKA